MIDENEAQGESTSQAPSDSQGTRDVDEGDDTGSEGDADTAAS